MLSDRTTHPRKVLDIGCGNGAWCIRAASLWPETTFVGLDLVAIQPDPYALERIAATRKGSKAGFKQSLEPPPSRKSTSSQGTARLPPLAPNSIYNRIKWVHHNFLTKRLPFKDDEFDLVRVRGIAQGVPEDEWTGLLTDLTRVLAPGGFLEIIEEDIIFPTVIAPTVTFGLSAKARQRALKSPAAQQALNKQSLIYPEESRPSTLISSTRGGGSGSRGGASYDPLSPVNPFAMYDDSTGISPPSPTNVGMYGIPTSYLHYAQTVPGLARSLPPLALLNPYVNQINFANQNETRPFAQDNAVLEQLYNAVFTKRWINLEPTSILGGVLGMQVSLCGVVASESLEIARPSGPRAIGGTDRGADVDAVGRRRGSGGSQTLLGENTVDGDDSKNDDDRGARPPSPPLTPTATSPLRGDDGMPCSPETSRRPGRERANTTNTTQSGGIRKYPALALTAALHTMFPNLDSDITRAFHLQRAWENVVACKEAMWEEFLADSANRDIDAYAANQNSSSPNSAVTSSGSFGSLGSLGSMGGLGGLGGALGPIGSMPTPSGKAFSNRGPRRAPTLLDELEWADSDQRRSERERFDILLDRYEMRIRRHCARILQTSTIPSFVPRDRHGWDADLYSSSDDDEIQLEYPEGPPSGVTAPNNHNSLFYPANSNNGQNSRPSINEAITEEGEESSSADEVTLAEPQSPQARPSISSLAPTHLQGAYPPSQSHPSGSSLAVPLAPMLAKLKLNAAALQLNTASNVTETPTTATRRKRRGRPSIDRQAKDESEAMPCRIVRAFIATKMAPTTASN